MKTPIVRDATDCATFDNHGQTVWVYLPPPSLRRHGMIRRTAVYIGLAAAFLMLLALLWLAAARPAAASIEHPGRAVWVCKYRLTAIDPPRLSLVCRRVK